MIPYRPVVRYVWEAGQVGIVNSTLPQPLPTREGGRSGRRLRFQRGLAKALLYLLVGQGTVVEKHVL
jgi:hypothetical protein